MLKVRYANQFKRDLKSCVKRRYNIAILEKVVDVLRRPDVLPRSNLDHALTGNYADYRECHVTPDWLLVYRYEDDVLFLYRTGTHSDLF